MSIKELKDMINLMHENGLTELEIEKNGFKIRLKKGPSGAVVEETRNPVQTPGPNSEPAQSAPAGAASKTVKDEGSEIVRSPMVGTFYIAPAPDTPPYVTVGKQVNEGDVLCIIEAMKLMNEIKSEVKGRIAEVLVENGQPIEFDQPLFKIQKS